jgi:peroxiredoxin/outer membrane lipoprotein-sorting protein
MKIQRWLALGVLLFTPNVGAFAASATAPTTAPSTAPSPMNISPEAKGLLTDVGQAYDRIQSAQLDGTYSIDLDIAGEKKHESTTFTSSFQSPGKFRHDMKNDVLVGSTGEKVYAFLAAKNSYVQADAPKSAESVDGYPAPIPQALTRQNPSLVLALATDAAQELSGNTKVEKVADVSLGDSVYPTLQLTPDKGAPLTLLIDPATHLIRQARFDLKSSAERQGAVDVKTALVTIDYTKVDPSPKLADDVFAWSPPQGAKEAKNQGAEDVNPAAAALVGKPAPEFTLADLNGTDVSLASLKGHVVVIDFWATWCGPCVESLPHLGKFYEENKEAGVKVFAIDLAEEKADVQSFVAEHKLSVPVLLDTDGKVAAGYGVNAIPQTVVIGKDGVIRKVMFFSKDYDQQLTDEVQAALQAK